MPAPPELLVDAEKVKKAVQSGMPLVIKTYTLPRETEIYIENLVGEFLKQSGEEKLRDYIVYCVRELAGNAKKANTKRVYFAEQGLDINNPDDYKQGMIAFKETTLGNIVHYLRLQEKNGLYILISLQVQKNIIAIEIRNNAPATKTELIRIHDKLARSRQYESMEEALSQVLDSSEGAGLGLVIMVLMLKKMGLNEDSFDIAGTENETICRLVIPFEQARAESLSKLSRKIADSINTLPHFPENIIFLQKLINDPYADMAAVGQQISMDPALTASLLKTVNSAHYMLPKKVDNIFEAVIMVGTKGIRNLIYSCGAQKLLGEDTQGKKSLWEHSYKTAFYAYNLVKNFRMGSSIIEDAYAGGILHDMGKIIFSNAMPDLLGKIKDFCYGKGLPASTFEDLSAGMNHAEIGALIAEKWNFPEALTASIRYHHDPASAPDEYKDIAEVIYLSNMFCEFENGAAGFDQFNQEALKNFGINSAKRLERIVEKLSNGFERLRAPK